MSKRRASCKTSLGGLCALILLSAVSGGSVARAASFEILYNFPDETSQIKDPLAVDSTGRLYGSFSYEAAGTTFVLTPPAAGSSAWTASEPFQFGQTPTAGSDPAGVLTPKKAVVLGTTGGGGIYGRAE